MSSYLNEPDTDSDEEIICTLTEEEKEEIKNQCLLLKQEGNEFFKTQQYEEAIKKYTAIINLQKTSKLPVDDIVLTNRSATYLALKKYVPASHDALQAAKINRDNWKAHWRYAISLLEMVPKRFRTKLAISALEECAKCSTLPPDKLSEVHEKLNYANARLAKQDAETPMPDMSNCAPS